MGDAGYLVHGAECQWCHRARYLRGRCERCGDHAGLPVLPLPGQVRDPLSISPYHRAGHALFALALTACIDGLSSAIGIPAYLIGDHNPSQADTLKCSNNHCGRTHTLPPGVRRMPAKWTWWGDDNGFVTRVYCEECSLLE